MSKDSLIESLEAAKHGYPNHPRGIGFDEGIDAAIAIVRQNHIGEPDKMVQPSEISSITVSSADTFYGGSRTDPRVIASEIRVVEGFARANAHSNINSLDAQCASNGDIGACDSSETKAECGAHRAHQLPEGWCTMGVGDGSGRLFVHGDYESIKACQALILRQPVPVSVSLKECIKALDDAWYNYMDSEERVINYCKAVLDAAGVKYVD